ncbi:unnamed protein product [marine sediment metagenome]|uniref:Uncharacterized protein n=1 Tax=marine sediment metagenome TaxID=412755 RepID=X0TKI2_9ZZZZ
MNKEESGNYANQIAESYTNIAENYYKNGFCTASAICQQAKQDGLFKNLEDNAYGMFQSCAFIVVVKQKMNNASN